MTYFNFLDFLMECAPVMPLLDEEQRPISIARPDQAFENESFLLQISVLKTLEYTCHNLRKIAAYNQIDLNCFSEIKVAMAWDGVETGELDDCELSSLIAGFGLESSIMSIHNDFIYKSDPLRLQFDRVSHPGLALQLGRAIYGENFAIPLTNPFDTSK